MAMQVQNPIIRGFNPDPSIVRVGEDYYIATSTFQWFPGICIHHSKDLANWSILGYALTDGQATDLTGIDASCGIWAPNLTHDGDLFYLTYALVYTDRQRYKDTYNYVVTAKDARGPWSAPVFLNRSGFDPAFYHEGTRKYLLNMVIDHRVGHERFVGIDMQEYDPVAKRLVGSPVRISPGTNCPLTEGPNLFQHNGYYYLTLAEGGTLYDHCTTVLRSKSLFGPYEENPRNPVLTAAGREDAPLKRAGHSQVIQGHDGNWYMAHLCSRPLKHCSILGRESAIQNIHWTEDGWFALSANRESLPEATFYVPQVTAQQTDLSERVDFATCALPLSYMTLRNSFAANGIAWAEGCLRIAGGASVMSKYHQGLVARRQQSFFCDFKAGMRFAPRHLNHIAGLLVYYDYDNHYYLKMSRDEQGIFLAVSANVNQVLTDTNPVYLPCGREAVYLKAEIRGEELQFYYSLDDHDFHAIGDVLDMKNISDERIAGNGFTGSMLGVNCCDLQGDGIFADFTLLDYQEHEGEA